MKVKDLLEEIERNKEIYPDFLEWDIYTEQCSEGDKEYKRKPSPPDGFERGTLTVGDVMDSGYGQGWEVVKCVEDEYADWEYFKCEGFNTVIPKKRIFTINVNY